ncbi:unnamed protein product, partial [Linum tenue]
VLGTLEVQVVKKQLVLVKELKNTHQLHILILVETQVSGTIADTAIQSFPFSKSYRSEARGNSLTSLSTQSQVIHLLVEVPRASAWILLAIYASPRPVERQNLWEELVGFSDASSLPWLLIGDFNEISSSAEKLGGTNVPPRRLFPLARNINNCGLVYFTWCRRDSRYGILQKRLDRGVFNTDWRLQFPEASITHLPRVKSDHCPLLLQTQ